MVGIAGILSLPPGFAGFLMFGTDVMEPTTMILVMQMAFELRPIAVSHRDRGRLEEKSQNTT